MNHLVNGLLLRRPEPDDLQALYDQKNNPEIAGLLGGFSTGYSRADITDWIEYHRNQTTEVLWAIVDVESNSCIGHVGFYNVDYRIRSAEFAIMIGVPSMWGKGFGRACTQFVLEYGFRELNLNRIYLSVISTNPRAVTLYRSLGFREEGCLRQAQYKGGAYVDVILMGLLRSEHTVHVDG